MRGWVHCNAFMLHAPFLFLKPKHDGLIPPVTSRHEGHLCTYEHQEGEQRAKHTHTGKGKAEGIYSSLSSYTT